MFDVLGWLNYLLDSLKNIVWGMFDSILNVFKDFFFWLLDSILSFGVGLLGSLPMPDFTMISGMWGLLPSGTLWMIQAVGLDIAAGMFISAVIVRLILMLVPFIR